MKKLIKKIFTPKQKHESIRNVCQKNIHGEAGQYCRTEFATYWR